MADLFKRLSSFKTYDARGVPRRVSIPSRVWAAAALRAHAPPVNWSPEDQHRESLLLAVEYHRLQASLRSRLLFAIVLAFAGAGGVIALIVAAFANEPVIRPFALGAAVFMFLLAPAFRHHMKCRLIALQRKGAHRRQLCVCCGTDLHDVNAGSDRITTCTMCGAAWRFDSPTFPHQ